MSIMLTTMNNVWIKPRLHSPAHCPMRLEMSRLGPSPETSVHSEVRNSMLPLLLPYVLAACQWEKKHTTFQTLSKGSTVISSTSVIIEKDWLYIILSQKQRIWRVRDQSYILLSSSRTLVLRETFCCNCHSRSKLVWN